MKINSRNILLQVSFLVFCVFTVIGIINHVLWRDEFHSWLIVLESHSFPELLNNRINEGHPLVWYLFISLIQWIYPSILFAKAIILLFVITSAYLLIKFSPFQTYQKILLIFGYYFLFEYAVFIRPYSLIVTILLLILVLQKNFDKHIISIGLLLAILINTQAHASVISGCLFLYFCIKNSKFLFAKNFKSIIFISLPVLATLFFLYDIFYLQDIGWANSSTISQVPHKKGVLWILRSIGNFQTGVLPISNATNLNFWGSSWLEIFFDIKYGLYYVVTTSFISTLLILSIIFILKINKLELLLFTVSTILLIILSTFFFQGDQRHFGFYYITLLILFWLIAEQKKFNLYQNRLFNYILIANIIGSSITIYYSSFYSFSNGEDVAKYIKSNYKEDIDFFGVPDYTIEPISGYLNKPFYNFQKNQMSSYIKWDYRDDLLDKREFESSISAINDLNSKKIIILSKPYFDLVLNGNSHNLKFIKEFDGAIVKDENYILFELR